MESELHIFDLESPIDLFNLSVDYDGSTNRFYFQINEKNISFKTVNKIIIKAYIFKSSKVSLNLTSEESINFMINDLNMAPNSILESDRKFYLINHDGVTNVEVIVESVYFSDGSAWKQTKNGLRLIDAEKLSDSSNRLVLDEGLFKNLYLEQDYEESWLCQCGRLNYSHLTKCARCNLNKSELKHNFSNINESDKLENRSNINNQKRKSKVLMGMILSLLIVSLLGISTYAFVLMNENKKLSDEINVETLTTLEAVTSSEKPTIEEVVSNNSETYNFRSDQIKLMNVFGKFVESEGFTSKDINADELGVDVINHFNNTWTEYVNYGTNDIFDLLIKDSPAYEGTIKFNAGDSKQRFLVMNVRESTLIGNELYIKVYEEIEITKPDGIIVKSYNWIYHARLEDETYKIYDYYNDENPDGYLPLSGDFINNETHFYVGGNFAGGDITDRISISDIRFGDHKDYERYVFDCYRFSDSTKEKSNIVPYYNVIYQNSSNSALFKFNGIREFTAQLDILLKSKYIEDFLILPIQDAEEFGFIVKFVPNAAIRVYEVENSARVILEIMK